MACPVAVVCAVRGWQVNEHVIQVRQWRLGDGMRATCVISLSPVFAYLKGVWAKALKTQTHRVGIEWLLSRIL